MFADYKYWMIWWYMRNSRRRALMIEAPGMNKVR
jgi:hypothetical protein